MVLRSCLSLLTFHACTVLVVLIVLGFVLYLTPPSSIYEMICPVCPSGYALFLRVLTLEEHLWWCILGAITQRIHFDPDGS